MLSDTATTVPTQSDLAPLLGSYADDWLAEIDGIGWSELARRQRGRLASLAFGAAGIAWAQRRAARARGDQRLLAAAERWIVEAVGRRRSRWAYHGSATGPRTELAPAALLYGDAGLWTARALIAHDLGDRRACGRAVGRLDECRRRSADEWWDFYSGAAGLLAGVALAYSEIGGPRLAALGRTIAAALARRVAAISGVPAAGTVPFEVAPAGSPAAWASPARTPRLGLGHGDAGLLYGLLTWSAASGDDPPAAVPAALERLVVPALEAPETFCPRPALRGSICNGFAGLALLAARARQVLGGAGWSRAAGRAAELALAWAPPRPDICCGRAGVAYACLAAAGADPAGADGWRRRAGELALSAMLVERADWEVGGLLGGEAGLVCLALDLAAGADSAPPAFGPPAFETFPGGRG